MKNINFNFFIIEIIMLWACEPMVEVPISDTSFLSGNWKAIENQIQRDGNSDTRFDDFVLSLTEGNSETIYFSSSGSPNYKVFPENGTFSFDKGTIIEVDKSIQITREPNSVRTELRISSDTSQIHLSFFIPEEKSNSNGRFNGITGSWVFILEKK